jgi:hypothetical protein
MTETTTTPIFCDLQSDGSGVFLCSRCGRPYPRQVVRECRIVEKRPVEEIVQPPSRHAKPSDYFWGLAEQVRDIRVKRGDEVRTMDELRAIAADYPPPSCTRTMNEWIRHMLDPDNKPAEWGKD